MTSDELELGHRLWLRLEKDELSGEDGLDPVEELLECPAANWNDGILCAVFDSISSSSIPFEQFEV